jgi:hypothetical protein
MRMVMIPRMRLVMAATGASDSWDMAIPISPTL